MFAEIFEDGEITKYIKDNTFDYWKDTPFEGYTALSPKNKGNVGEMFVEKYMRLQGSDIQDRENSGHDRIIDNYKTEIKFSLGCNNKKTKMVKEDEFRINHLSKGKDWERLIFFGVSPQLENCRFLWCDKVDFDSYMQSGNGIFSNQQGGINLNNDDFMFSGKFSLFTNLPFVKDIKDWTKKTVGVEVFYA